MKEEYAIMTGNEACAKAAIAAGMRFFAGYPITPATEIAEISSELLPQVDGTFMQMEDELASIAAVIGASCAGAKAMTATSGPGFTLMQENLSFGIVAEIPLVLVDAVRQGPCQGVATVAAQGDIMQAKWGSHGDRPIIALVPESVSEVYTETVRAFNLAEKFRTPVIILSDAMLAHMSERIRIPEPSKLKLETRKQPTVSRDDYQPYTDDGTGIPPMASFGDGYRWYVSGLAHDETGFPIRGNPGLIEAQIKRLHAKLNNNLAEIESYEEFLTSDAEILLVSIGLVSRSAKEAVKDARAMGIKAGVFRPITMWPFPYKPLRALCAKAKKIIVVEMNEGQLFHVVREASGNSPVTKLTQNDGQIITAEKILNDIKKEAVK